MGPLGVSNARARRGPCGRRFRIFCIAFAASAGVVAAGQPAGAQNHIVEETTLGQPVRKYRILPFVMYNRTLEFTGAASVIARGMGQPQSYFQNTVFVSTNESYFALLSLNDLRLVNRMFVTAEARGGQFGLIKVYSGTDEAGREAGRNDSDAENHREAEGIDVAVKATIRYLLPIGHGRGNPVTEIRMREGDVIAGRTGAAGHQPFASGRTFLELGPFYTYRDVDERAGSETRPRTTSTNGLEMGLTYENVDFSENPRQGANYGVTFVRDFGWGDSDTEWSAVEARYARFLPVLRPGLARHSVLALGVWSSHCLTWDAFRDRPDGTRVYRRPPSTMGSTLGGAKRLRGYDVSRFSDRSALLYVVEYRHTPNWGPIRFKLLGAPVNVSWIQLVGFFEAGRVAPDWRLEELHTDMKWDAGIGMRPWVGGILPRVDMGMSEEGQFFAMTIKQSF